jgi:hypothetical protein
MTGAQFRASCDGLESLAVFAGLRSMHCIEFRKRQASMRHISILVIDVRTSQDG